MKKLSAYLVYNIEHVIEGFEHVIEGFPKHTHTYHMSFIRIRVTSLVVRN